MKANNYLIKTKTGAIVGVISIYRIPNQLKLTSYCDFNQSVVLTLLKKQNFDQLDNLIEQRLVNLAHIVELENDRRNQLKFQNKLSGLQALKRKISNAKIEYLKDSHNQLNYNKLINLYNSIQSFL